MPHSRVVCIALTFAVLVGWSSAGDEAPKVEQKQVDAAIQKGVTYLRGYAAKAQGGYREKVPWVDPAWVDELVLLTFLHAGVPETDPDFQKLFKFMLERKYTVKERRLLYCVVFQALILEEVDRVKFQDRIQQCAQWLVDVQCQNGQWDPYGTPSAAVEEMNDKLTSSIKDIPKAPDPFVPVPRRPKPKVVKTVEVKKLAKGDIGGDNGASYFAALGLWACRDAGVVLPKEVLLDARKWWVDSQPGHERGSAAKGMGWCYCEKRNPKLKCTAAYGSATAGGSGALAIYDRMLGLDSRKNKSIDDAVAWVASQPSLTQEQEWYYSYYFALQNAGILLDTEKFGDRDWYREGVKLLLGVQLETGAWPQKHPPHEWLQLSDTCFAILFLKRATRPFDAAEGGATNK